MSKTHNKKRSVAFVHEILVRTIAQGLVEGDKKLSSKALKILKRRFKPGTELYKEFRLANSLLRTVVISEGVAMNILHEAKKAARNHDSVALDKEKSMLVHEINVSLGAAAFEQKVPDYTDRATVQTLFNDWRSDSPDLERLGLYEDKLVKMLLTQREVVQEQYMSESPVDDELLVAIMSKKIDEKYATALTESQRKIMRAYVTGEGIDVVMQEVKDALVKESASFTGSDDVRTKMCELNEKLLSETTEVTDENVEKFMEYASLLDELRTPGENEDV